MISERVTHDLSIGMLELLLVPPPRPSGVSRAPGLAELPSLCRLASRIFSRRRVTMKPGIPFGHERAPVLPQGRGTPI